MCVCVCSVLLLSRCLPLDAIVNILTAHACDLHSKFPLLLDNFWHVEIDKKFLIRGMELVQNGGGLLIFMWRKRG